MEVNISINSLIISLYYCIFYVYIGNTFTTLTRRDYIQKYQFFRFSSFAVILFTDINREVYTFKLSYSNEILQDLNISYDFLFSNFITFSKGNDDKIYALSSDLKDLISLNPYLDNEWNQKYNEHEMDWTQYKFNSFDTYDGTNLIVCGDDNIILKSSDSGENWQEILLNNVEKTNLMTIHYINKDNVLITGINIVLISKDGGDSWHEISLPYPESFYTEKVSGRVTQKDHNAVFNMSEFSFFDEMSVNIISESEIIMSSKFLLIYYNYYYYLFIYIYFQIDNSGIIFKSTDAGETWSFIDKFTSESRVTSYDYLNDKHIISFVNGVYTA